MSMDTVMGGGSVERTLKLHQTLNTFPNVNSKILSIDSGQKNKPDIPEKEIIQLPCWNRRWYLPVPRLKVVRELLRWADVVHIMNHWTIINAWVYLLVRVMKKPYVVCPAGSLTIFGRSIILKKLYQFIIGHKLIQNASAGIVISDDEINDLKKDGLKSNLIHHIPNGVSEDDFKFDDPRLFRQTINLDKDEPYILFVGRLNKIKGPDLLLDAFISINDDVPQHLVFVGPDEGMQSSLIQTVSENNLTERVHFAGFIGGDLKSSAYHGAALLVVPSRHEAMSIVALEAAITGTPVLLTNQCGFSALVEADGAIEVSPTVDGLKKGLRKLLLSPEKLRDMCDSGRLFAQKNYTWKIIADQYMNIFSKLAKQKTNLPVSEQQDNSSHESDSLLDRVIFPFAFSLNMFSMTALLIVLGIFGEAEIAADVGIVQAAALVVFMAFGTNARNIILSKNTSITLHQFFKFRSILVFPLAIVAYLLSKGFIDLANEVVFCLILRRSIEWITELQINERELEKDKGYAYLYSGIQIVTFLALLVSINTGLENYYYIFLIIWSISPGYQLIPFVKQLVTTDEGTKLSLTAFLPHLGSTWIIAISTYVFRVIIILLAGKTLGGLLFSAYAIGGMINSIYTYALGPSLAARKDEKGSFKEWNVTKLVLLVLVLLGGVIALFSMNTNQSELPETNYYYLAVGLSLIGSGIMLLAQRKRIHLLQIDKNSVFVPDVLINILIISTVPFAYYLLGSNVLVTLFLWNAFLNYFIYSIPSIDNKWHEKSGLKKSTRMMLGFLKRSNIQVGVLVLLIAPVFFN